MSEVLNVKKSLSLDELANFLRSDESLSIPSEIKGKIQEARDFLDREFSKDGRISYGINTGFGDLYNIHISADKLDQLQENLVMSHACGMGQEVPEEIVSIMLLLKARSLSYGFSGVQLKTIEGLVDFYNKQAYPIVYKQGSLGASGDLAPLANLALPLIGMGEINVKGEKISAEAYWEQQENTPVKLRSKEGLALLNGTQFMLSYATWCAIHAKKLNYLADLLAALSVEGYDGRVEPFDERLHYIRPHAGQVKTAERMREFLSGSEIITQAKKHVQDPYSLRCVPQVHGASKDACNYVYRVFETEMNSVTDNPNLFIEDGDILSGGNFHGQPLALALDHLKLALHELGSISERRTYLLVGGERDLPAFLVANPGINSGLMIPQYAAASLVSANKQLCTPASADSITSSNGQEDHVSMGANAATQCFDVVNNLYGILAVELLTASQAIHFREPLKTSPFLESILMAFRAEVPIVEQDRILHQDIDKAKQFLMNLEVDPELL